MIVTKLITVIMFTLHIQMARAGDTRELLNVFDADVIIIQRVNCVSG